MYLWSVCVDPSWQKDFGAKELYNTGRGRCVNAQAFSFYLIRVQGKLASSHLISWVVAEVLGFPVVILLMDL